MVDSFKVVLGMSDNFMNVMMLGNPYEKKQHPNQQCGTDEYVDVIDLRTGERGSVKIYVNTKGKHIKKNGVFYIDEMNINTEVCEFQFRKV